MKGLFTGGKKAVVTESIQRIIAPTCRIAPTKPKGEILWDWTAAMTESEAHLSFLCLSQGSAVDYCF